MNRNSIGLGHVGW